MNGIINIYKEKGYTSHDAVARVRGVSGQRRVGHTGTLDPDAEGVLPICLGTATKVCDMLTDKSKVYETVLLLGIATDTQDVSGKITSKAEPKVLSELTKERIEEVIKQFVGEYMQYPPMFSAVKVNGQKLYDMARAGLEVEREPRNVEILSIEILSDILKTNLCDADYFIGMKLKESSVLARFGIENDIVEKGRWRRVYDSVSEDKEEDCDVIRVALRIECSKGTYIRTLCNDIGEKLGCYGCMEKLLRTRVGEFRIEDSIKIADAEILAKEGKLEEVLKTPDECFKEYTRLDTKEKYDDMLYNGNILYFRHFTQYITEAPSPVKVYSSKGEFLAVYEFDDSRNRYKPLKIFRDDK